jgi:hypothetical protein
MVLQGSTALGSGGHGLGYSGIANCVAIELDIDGDASIHDPSQTNQHQRDVRCPSGPHVSVHTRYDTALESCGVFTIPIAVEAVPRTLQTTCIPLAVPASRRC